jgi:hypothetical protein
VSHKKRNWHRRTPSSPDNDLLHYCRSCTQSFTTNEQESAHRQALIHHIHDHDQEAEFKRCSRYCDLKAQPEELSAGHKLYGPGYVHTPTGKSPDELRHLMNLMAGYDEE